MRQWLQTTINVMLVLTAPVLASAQANGRIQGRIVDAQGSVIAGAQVLVQGDGNGVRLATQSDDDGLFNVPSLAPGGYRVEVSQNGFRTQVQHATVRVNQALRLDVALQVGGASETVTVNAPSASFDRLTPMLAFRMDPEHIANLPLDGRNFLDLALLAPGTAPAAQGSAGSVRGDFAFNVSGAREDANAYLLDGAYNVDPKLNGVAVRPPVDGIREFEVVTSTPDASFGRSAGGQVNVVTRSGTNMFRGAAYDYVRVGAFNARNYFAPKNEDAPDYNRNQFGTAMGGAIKKDRLFFFADYEGTRLTEGLTRVTNVPTLAERNGDFTQSLLPTPRDPFTGQPLPFIPDFVQNPVGRAIAALYPEPNRSTPFANYVSSPESTDDVNQFDLRVDARREGKALTARYSFSDRNFFEPFAGSTFSAVPGYGNDVPRRAQNLVVTGTRPFGSRILNEARVGMTHISGGVTQQGQGTSINQLVGLPDLSSNPRDWGLSFISVQGFSPLGHEYNNPQENTTSLWQFGDTLTWSRGKHFLKMGGELRFINQEAFRDVQARGLLNFTNFAFTGNALADLLLGLPSVTVGATLDNPQNLSTTSAAFFLQDSVSLSPTVTLTAGLRYELNTPPVDKNDRVTLYDPETGQLVPAGTEGMPRGGYETDTNNFAPRLGAAWAVRPDTIVRGGYGISYDQSALAPNEFLYFNSPYFDLNTYFSVGAPVNYLLTLNNPFPANFPLFVPDSATSVQRDLKTGFLHHWNLDVQRQIGATRSIEVSYVGTRGRNLIAARDINQPAPSPVVPNLRPNPLFADIIAIESRATSSYNALEVRLDQRLNRGVAFTAAYTLGKSMDDASGFFSSTGDPNFPQDSNNPSEWARSNFDVRHRLAMSGTWQLPFGTDRKWLHDGGFAATCLGNWDIHAILSLQSGRPLTIAVHPDIDRSNTGRKSLGFGFNDRPNQSGNADVASPDELQWFNTAAFSFPEFGTFGNVGRNTVEGPGYKNLNFALTRNAGLGRGSFQIRLELYNAFNWTNFDLPDNFLGSPTFGQILSAGAPRRMQLGLRYEW